MHIRWDLVLVSLSLVAGLSLAGCGRTPPRAGVASTTTGKTANTSLSPDEEFVVGPGVTYANLTLFPITSRTARDKDRLITLDEGLAAGTVEVRELGAGQGRFGQQQAAMQRTANEGPRANTNNAARQPVEDPFGEAPAADVGQAHPEPALGAELAQIEVTLDDPFGPAGNQVNCVLVHNKSDKPLYLMPGEIILGGDQDRTIGQELVIAPSDKPVQVEVFCVEHGRWGGKGQAQTVAQLSALAHAIEPITWDEHTSDLSLEVAQRQELIQEQAAEADQGKFVVSAGALNKSGRLAAQRDKSQGKVWDQVAAANGAAGVEIASGAFTGQYVEADAVKRLEPYLKELSKAVIDEPQVVGVVVAIDGKVESFDVFESTPLFSKLWPKLLKSYAVDAANANEGRDAESPAPKVCTQAVAAAFVKEAITAKVTGEEQSGDLAIAKRDTDKVLLFTAHDPTQRPFVTSVIPNMEEGSGISGRPAAPEAAFGGGGLGGSVHGFGAAK